MPSSVFYDPVPAYTGVPDAYVALEGHGVIRIDGLSPDLSVGEAICGACAIGLMPGQDFDHLRVELVVPTLGTRTPVQLDAGWHVEGQPSVQGG